MVHVIPRDGTVEAVFLSLATRGKSNGVLEGVIAVCHRTSHLILTDSSLSTYSLLCRSAEPS